MTPSKGTTNLTWWVGQIGWLPKPESPRRITETRSKKWIISPLLFVVATWLSPQSWMLPVTTTQLAPIPDPEIQCTVTIINQLLDGFMTMAYYEHLWTGFDNDNKPDFRVPNGARTEQEGGGGGVQTCRSSEFCSTDVVEVRKPLPRTHPIAIYNNWQMNMDTYYRVPWREARNAGNPQVHAIWYGE